jgi:hypothetical protein
VIIPPLTLETLNVSVVIPAPARETRGKNGGDPGKPIVSKEPLARTVQLRIR